MLLGFSKLNSPTSTIRKLTKEEGKIIKFCADKYLSELTYDINGLVSITGPILVSYFGLPFF